MRKLQNFSGKHFIAATSNQSRYCVASTIIGKIALFCKAQIIDSTGRVYLQVCDSSTSRQMQIQTI